MILKKLRIYNNEVYKRKPKYNDKCCIGCIYGTGIYCTYKNLCLGKVYPSYTYQPLWSWNDLRYMETIFILEEYGILNLLVTVVYMLILG